MSGNSVCIYCARSYSFDLSYYHSSRNLLHRFLTLVRRHFERNQKTDTKFIHMVLQNENNYNCEDSAKHCADNVIIAECPECAGLLRSCCDFYHEIKCLELKLLWRLQTFVKIMKLGGRLPTRVAVLKKACENLDEEDDLHRDTSNAYEKVERFRKQLIKTCCQINTFPKVILTSISQAKVEPSTPNKDNVFSHRRPSKISTNEDNVIIYPFNSNQTHLLSLVAIIFLHYSVNGLCASSTAEIFEPQEDESLRQCDAEWDNYDMLPVDFEVENAIHSDADPESNEELYPEPQFSETCDKVSDCTPTSNVKSKKNAKESSDCYIPPSSNNLAGSESTDQKAHDNPEAPTSEPGLKNHNSEAPSYNVFENHKLQVTGNTRYLRKKYRCEVCTKIFSTAANLDLHKNVHSINSNGAALEAPEGEATFSGDSESDMHGVDSANESGDMLVKEECGFTTEDEIDCSRSMKKLKQLRFKKGKYKTSSTQVRQSPGEMDNLKFLEHELVRDMLQSKMLPNDENAPSLHTFLTNNADDMFTHHCTVDGCSDGFLTEKELTKHTKLHGEFKCNFCDAVETYAPDLARHEKKCATGTSSSSREEYSKPKHKAKVSQRDKNKNEICTRCSWESGARGTIIEFVAHFVEIHFELEMPLGMTCPLCRRRFFHSTAVPLTKENLMKHVLLTHDVSGRHRSQIFTCKICPTPVNFRDWPRLVMHKKEVHQECRKTCSEPGCEGMVFASLGYHMRKCHQSIYKVACDEPDCKTRFKTESDLRKHKCGFHRASEAEKTDNPFVCEICDDGFDKKYKLVLHKFKHEKDYEPRTMYSFTCPHNCVYATLLRSYGQLETHLREHHDFVLDDSNFDPSVIVQVKPDKLDLVCEEFECKFQGCRKKFGNQMELENHRKHHGNFECQICKKKFKDALALALHEAKHEQAGTAKLRSISCPRCVKEFRLSQYLQHFLSVHLALPWATVICSICKKSQVHLKNLQANKLKKMHFNSHHKVANMKPEDVRKCSECPAYFKTFRQLGAHRLDVHGFDALTCKECGQQFPHRHNLRLHLKNRHGQDHSQFNFACEHAGCSQRFPTAEQLELHSIVHSIKRPKFTCSKCQKTFTFPKTFEQHVVYCGKGKRRMPSQRTHVCETCGKSFYSGENLRLHNLSHLGPESWRFTCETCGKKCLTKDKVEEHMRTHTKEKPFQCQICGVKYAHRHNLRIHVNSKHGDITQDIPKPFDKSNLTSRKGIPTGKTGPRDGDRKRPLKSKHTSITNKRKKREEVTSSSEFSETDEWDGDDDDN